MAKFAKLLLVAGLCLPSLVSAAVAAEQGKGTGQFHGASPALGSLPPATAQEATPQVKQLFLPQPAALSPGATAPNDRGLQSTPQNSAATTTLGQNILGLGSGFPGFNAFYAPPDANAAVGATQVVETVNLSFAVFNKSNGSALEGPVALSSLFSGAGNNCETGALSDPTVLFDKANQRWVITFLAATSGGPIGFSKPFLQCLAVSQGADATGAYLRYSFDLTTGLGTLSSTGQFLNDYPKLGIRPDAYFMSFNEFDASTTAAPFQGSLVCAIQSSAMTGTGPNPQILCSLLPLEDSLLPADDDGATPPPAGEPEVYVGTLNGGTSFNILTAQVDFAVDPASSTLTIGVPVSLTTNNYAEACGGGTCIPQNGTREQLDSLGDRLMHRAAYRAFLVNGILDHESIVVSHSVRVGSLTTQTGARWYELRNPAGNSPTNPPTIFQQGTYAPDTLYRWMPSIAMDKLGDIAMGYSVSSSGMYPSIRVTGRASTDTVNLMGPESTIVAGSNKQTQTSRWGDYSSMSIDPTDDCTFWYTQEYIKNRSNVFSFNWSTRLAAFKLSTCH